MNFIIPLLSRLGVVFGIIITPVNPPFIAALLPLSKVSFCSFPGSEKLACKSNQPGDRCKFGAEYSISVPFANDSLQDLIDLAIFSILPSLINTSIILLWYFELESIILADLISKFMI